MPTTLNQGVENEDRILLNPAIMTTIERQRGRFMRAPDHESGGVDSAADAILNRWLDAGSLSDDDGGATSKKGSETDPDDDEENESENESEQDDAAAQDDEDQDDAEDAEDDGDEDDDNEEPAEAGDDAVVKITVDGEARTVSVKDLKRLYGQEASLTRKSQEVASARKKADTDGARYTTAMQSLIGRAQERFAPYAKIDWLVAQQQLEPTEFAALRAEARQVQEELQFLNTGVNSVFEQAEKARKDSMAESAKAAIEVLQKDIPNWSQATYDNIRSYAVKQGLAEDDINQVTDPAIIKLLHKAMLHDSAKAKLITKKKAAAPKRVMKSKGKAATIMGKRSAEEEISRLKTSGSQDDAAAAFMARWAADSD